VECFAPRNPPYATWIVGQETQHHIKMKVLNFREFLVGHYYTLFQGAESLARHIAVAGTMHFSKVLEGMMSMMA